ncbi:variable surface protein [Plasmodium gonderi]|uniref:Variable surface protein n=1 Tax=Plasmodium gonderi TaxID=77519 RepID=A0A1Y1JSA0_PLAGO|nr:variable surface protein [Plasmodium gonderi]GAW84328.1 variable surface protein [Plasmodium gonderi]
MEGNMKIVIFTRILIFILLAWIYPYFNKGLFYKKIYFILFIQCLLGTYLDNTYNKNKTLHIQNERLLAKNDFPKKRENKDLGVPLSLQNEHIRLKNKSENIPMNKTVEVCRKNAITHNKNGLKVSLSYHNGNMKFKNEAENMPLNTKDDLCRKNSIPHNNKGLKGTLSYNNDNMGLKNEAGNRPLNIKNEQSSKNVNYPHNKDLNVYLSCNKEEIMLKNNSKNIQTNKELQKYSKSSLLCDNKGLNETTTKYKKLKWIDYYFEKKIFSHLEKLYKHKEHDNIMNKNSKRSSYRMKCVCGFLSPVIVLVGGIIYIFFGPNPGSTREGQSTMGPINPLYVIPFVTILAIYLGIVFYIILKVLKYKRLKVTNTEIK